MTVSVLVPFLGGCEWRQRALDHVSRVHAEVGEVVVGRCRSPWRKAAAVHDAVERSSGEVLVVADADCVVDVARSVVAVQQGAAWSMPHHTVNRLDQQATLDVYAGTDPAATTGRTELPYKGSYGGGVVVLTRDTWERCPLDARFVGWGQEDLSWALALNTLAGRCERFAAELFHLWHPPAVRASRGHGNEAGLALHERYRAARRAPDAMAELTGEAREVLMDPTRLMTEACTVTPMNAATVDEYGTETLGAGTPFDTTCLLSQTQRSEAEAGGNVQAETFALYLPPDTTIDGSDRVSVDGVVYELDGPPWPAFNPRLGRTTHIEATVKRAT